MDELLVWLPDGPAGWALVGVAVLAIAWWCVRRLPGRLFRYTSRVLARRRNWLVKSGPGTKGGQCGLAGDGQQAHASWEHNQLPRTHLELLGEHRGYVFHARQQRTSEKTSAGHPGEHSYRWRYDYVVSLATTSTSYDGFFTADVRQTVTDPRLALYPAFLEWERKVFPLFDSSSYSPPQKFRRGHGIISAEKRNRRLSGRTLLNHLDALVEAAATRQ